MTTQELLANKAKAIESAHYEAKPCFWNNLPERSRETHYSRFIAICQTIELLGLEKDWKVLANDIWESEYCDSVINGGGN